MPEDFEEGTQETEVSETGQADPYEGLSGFGRDYITKVPEEQREIVAQHLKEWDANHSRYAQDVSAKLKPWEELQSSGVDPQTARQAAAFYQEFMADPSQSIKQVAEALNIPLDKLFTPPAPSDESWKEALPEPVVQRLSQLDELNTKFGSVEKTLQGLAQYLNQDAAAKKEAQERAEFERLQTETFTKHKLDKPELQRMWLSFVGAGSTPDDAAAQVKALVQEAINSRAPAPAPKLLSGNGGVPGSGVDVKKASKDEITDLIANMISGGN